MSKLKHGHTAKTYELRTTLIHTLIYNNTNTNMIQLQTAREIRSDGGVAFVFIILNLS